VIFVDGFSFSVRRCAYVAEKGRHIMRRRPLRILLRSDLESRGIPWSRQHIDRKIKDGTFPPPDGKTSNAPSAPNFWLESTIDRYLRGRVKALAAMRAKDLPPPDTS
jgi:hypothetical protein